MVRNLASNVKVEANRNNVRIYALTEAQPDDLEMILRRSKERRILALLDSKCPTSA